MLWGGYYEFIFKENLLIVKGLRLTRNQHQVLMYLIFHSDGARFVKVSKYTLAREFGWNDVYVEKVLRTLQEKDAITLVLSGVGRRPNKYYIQKIDMATMIVIKKQKRQSPAPETKTAYVYRGPGLKGVATTIAALHLIKSKRKIAEERRLKYELTNDIEERYVTRTAGTGVYATTEEIKPSRLVSSRQAATPNLFVQEPNGRLTFMSKLGRDNFNISWTKTSSGPFMRFWAKRYAPSKWNANDVICFWACLFRFEYGAMPVVDWRGQSPHAKRLLERFDGRGREVRHFLKAAMYSFSQNFSTFEISVLLRPKVYERIMRCWERDVDGEYPDEDVFSR